MRVLRIALALGLAAAIVSPQAHAEDGINLPPRGPILVAQKASDASRAKDSLAPTKRPAFKPPRLSHADLLATGDQRVMVKWSNGLHKDCWLVRLEKSWAILRDVPGGEPTLINAASKTIVEIVTNNKKFTWKLAPDQKSFEGKAQESTATEKVTIDPKPATRRQVEQLLLLSFRRMANRAIDGVASLPSPSEVAEIRAIAASRCEAIRRSGLADSIAGLYAALPGVLDVVAEQVAIQDRLIAEYNEQIKAQVAERRKIAQRRAMASMVGMAKMFFGAMPDQQIVHAGFGQAILVDRGPVSPELMVSGMRDVVGASSVGASELAILDNIKEMMDQKQREAMAASILAQTQATEGLRGRFEEVATGEYQLPRFVPIPQDEWAKPRRVRADYQPLIDRLAAACDRETEPLGRPNPFAQLDLLFFQGLVPVLNRGDQLEVWQSQARDAIKLAGELPSDPILDHDRAEILTTGAELALRAAEMEIGPGRWGDSYHPRALFAAKVLDLALKYAPDDPSGRFREKKAQALLMSGQVVEALKVAREVAEIRGEMPRYRFQLARIECAAGEVDKGLDDLEAAIVTLGFPDVHEARRRGGDFPQGDKRFKALTSIDISIDGKVPRGFGVSGPKFVVTNLSQFPLTDVTISVEYSTIVRRAVGNRPEVTSEHPYFQKLARLDPNESMVIGLGKASQVKVRPDGTIYGRVQLASRQGVTKIYSSK